MVVRSKSVRGWRSWAQREMIEGQKFQEVPNLIQRIRFGEATKGLKLERKRRGTIVDIPIFSGRYSENAFLDVEYQPECVNATK